MKTKCEMGDRKLCQIIISYQKMEEKERTQEWEWEWECAAAAFRPKCTIQGRFKQSPLDFHRALCIITFLCEKPSQVSFQCDSNGMRFSKSIFQNWGWEKNWICLKIEEDWPDIFVLITWLARDHRQGLFIWHPQLLNIFHFKKMHLSPF